MRAGLAHWMREPWPVLSPSTGGPHDPIASRVALEKSCRLKEPVGCAHLGRLYADGVEGLKGRRGSLDLLQQSCSNGAEEGCAYLGLLYAKGIGVSQDLVLARPSLEGGCALDWTLPVRPQRGLPPTETSK